jgi:DNA-binding protein HU-beta
MALCGKEVDVNKSQLVDRIARATKQPNPEVAATVDALIDTIRAAVTKGDKVVLSGFGTFYRQPRARRVARNIWADQRVIVPATYVPAFKPGKPFKEAVARPRRRRAATGPKARRAVRR